MILLRIIFYPFSILYGFIIQIRNILYDRQFLTVNRFNKPVISIGNITMGGSGKTPMTIYLANLLVNKGKKVAVISRGYGRKSKGFHLISDGLTHEGITNIHGDEPVLISLLVPNAIIAVGEKRSEAIKKILDQCNVDVFILDDGFQHRSVYRDIDIVILKDETYWKNNFVIPCGMLREFKFNLKRADIIINRGDVNPRKNSFDCITDINGLVDIDFKNAGELEKLSNKKCVAFAGIADPENFKKDLLARGILLESFISYRDHYNYQHTDIAFLVNECNMNHCEYLLCTQKDLVKIREINGDDILKRNNIHLRAAVLNLSLTNGDSFLKKIESHLDWFGKR